MKRFYPALIYAASTLAPTASHAAVTAKDIQVAGRVLAFTTTPLTGNVKVGIVYDPTNAVSMADEQALLGILGSGLAIGAMNLIPVPVTNGNIATTPTDIIFLTAGLGADAAKAGAQAAAEKIICITTDLTATQSGYCAVNVQTNPKVQITINTATLAASGVSFATAFMQMITRM